MPAPISGLRRSTRSSHHTHAARTIACGYSDSSWSVWGSRIGAVASTAAMAIAMPRPARRRTMPWTSTIHMQKQATSTSFRRP